ncbi:MAG: phosphoglycerate dehydrogenase [Pseudomonadales bacterium]|jgi:D-3-phosphoglycerate dehydrogenase|nr:phosphoglycerate dehydrogenase [Pseudomonadales bacterium]MCP5215629.1 phosphoglycerate dehydrogenase [Pseudomonadales bacterium]
MYKIQTLNNISIKGLERFTRDKYEVASEIGHPDAILLRSHKLSEAEIPASVKAIGRAGAGVNNVPVARMTELGIPVFNSPGANANAVKELVLAALLLGSRGIVQGINYVNSLTDLSDAQAMSKLLEQEKKRFRGQEIAGKTLGVIGLGSIGSRVARMALEMGMEVLGYDPALSVDAAWRLPSEVRKMENLQSLMAKSDFVTLHLPAIESTYHLVNTELLAAMKPDACLVNFAREEIVDSAAVAEALTNDKLRLFVTDFPTPVLIRNDKVILMPHIGASTQEAEDNCAVMAANQLIDFLENGNIVNAVNFPPLSLERSTQYRLAVVNKNVPKMLGSVLSVLADMEINVVDMLNKSRDDIAYNLIDIESPVSEDMLASIKAIQGVINVRVL